MDGLETTPIEDCHQNEAMTSEPSTRMSRDHGSDMGHFEELEHVSLMMSFRNAVPLDLLIRLLAIFLYLIYYAN